MQMISITESFHKDDNDEDEYDTENSINCNESPYAPQRMALMAAERCV